MRLFDNGSFYTVSYSEIDSKDFSSRWPCSTVRGRGSFQFQRSNGDLIDATGTAASGDDGADWVAFSQDCQQYGLKKLSESS